MKIITISGLDGSGKSTQIKMLKNHLEAQGKSVFCFHAVEFSLVNKFRIKNAGKSPKGATKAGTLSVWMRKLFLKTDLARFKKMSRALARKGYDYILSDRYFYDSAVNIQYLLGSPAPEWKPDLRIPKPDIAIFLKADPEIIMSRERKPEQGLAYLKKKNELYTSSVRMFDLMVIDGTRPKGIIFEEIKKYL